MKADAAVQFFSALTRFLCVFFFFLFDSRHACVMTIHFAATDATHMMHIATIQTVVSLKADSLPCRDSLCCFGRERRNARPTLELCLWACDPAACTLGWSETLALRRPPLLRPPVVVSDAVFCCVAGACGALDDSYHDRRTENHEDDVELCTNILVADVLRVSRVMSERGRDELQEGGLRLE